MKPEAEPTRQHNPFTGESLDMPYVPDQFRPSPEQQRDYDLWWTETMRNVQAELIAQQFAEQFARNFGLPK